MPAQPYGEFTGGCQSGHSLGNLARARDVSACRSVVLAFNFAVQRGYATDNPAEKTAKAKERGGGIGILTVTQAARLLESATPEALPYIAIGLFAGLRRAEIERLDWSEVDFESGLIRRASRCRAATVSRIRLL
jgi:integrase